MRTFISIDLPSEVTEELAAAASSLRFKGVRLTPPEKMHLTLAFIGNISTEDAFSMASELRKIQRSKFKIQFRGFDVFKNNSETIVYSPVSIGADELKALRHDSAEKVDPFLVNKLEPHFTPHVTLAKVVNGVAIDAFPEFIRMKSMPFGSFIAQSFHIKKSIPTKNGHRHESIREITLF